MSPPGRSPLHSQWLFVYGGETPGIATRKIERFLGRKLLDVRMREDWPHQGMRRPMIDCLIACESADWQEALRETLQLACRITPQWSTTFYGIDSDIVGDADRVTRNKFGGFTIGGPACLLMIRWRLRLDQDYPRY